MSAALTIATIYGVGHLIAYLGFLRRRPLFRRERIILAHDGCWVGAGAVFINSDETDVPGAALVRPAVNELALWRRVGVADRPTADLAIAWLGRLPTGQVLPAADQARVRALLGRYPSRIWTELGQWLNLAGEWTGVDRLRYALGTVSCGLGGVSCWGWRQDWGCGEELLQG